MHSDQVENLAIEKIEVETDHRIALDSLDHLNPLGTAQDNSKNPRFNQSLYNLFLAQKRFIRVLDLGCSGGGFVKSCIDDGCLAVGIEGSDFSQRLKRAEWATLDQHFLFTADITKPFQVNAYVKEKKVPLKFDVVTAWEVLEHIEEKDLPALFSNIKKHLLPGGLAIFSVCARDAWFMGVNLHRTTQLKEWWIKKTDEEGFLHHPELIPYFSPHFVRGPRRQKKLSFHLILSLKGFPPPKPPKKTLKHHLYRRWIGSYLQKWIKKLLV